MDCHNRHTVHDYEILRTLVSTYHTAFRALAISNTSTKSPDLDTTCTSGTLYVFVYPADTPIMNVIRDSIILSSLIRWAASHKKVRAGLNIYLVQPLQKEAFSSD